MQNNILDILKQHELIPVVTINSIEEVDSVYKKLISQNITCIEITLRNKVAWEAIGLFKSKYGDKFSVGVGTITSVEHIERCKNLKVDFMVSPGLNDKMIKPFEDSGIAFLPGVSTPSEIISAMSNGWRCFKFFPANLFGGLSALKTYGNVFSEVIFCPTGGINGDNFKAYLALDNVYSVGGSWVMK